MQDNWQDFDRHIQSVMHDAGERVPRRVWKAVSARLDSAAAPVAWWKWAVPAFVAAALAAGLFFAGTRNSGSGRPDEIQIIADSGTTPEQAASSLLADLLPEDVPASVSGTSGAAGTVRRHSPSGTSVPADISGVKPDDEASGVEADGGKQDVTNPYVDGEQQQGRNDNENQDNSGEWARIMQEDNIRKGTTMDMSGLYARGGVGGNDSNISYGGNGISRMAPGAGSPDAGITESGPSSYGVPFTIGLGARFHVADKLSFGTGLDYSMLTRSFKGTYSGAAASAYEGTIYHTVHYIGVPLNVYYDLLSTRDGLMNVYTWGGGSADYCIANSYRLMSTPASVVPDKAGGFQFSAALGMGLEFKLSDKLGLYLDPAVRYYFHSPGQPKSVRTDKPFMFNFDAGLRFNF
ncbi:MAG: PorT family protein [Bacteroidales bacterium]|nr:PorT family protein [Bacteroidales bacterium]